MICTVKGYSVVSEAEVGVFLEFPCFFYDSVAIGKLISGSSTFSLGNGHRTRKGQFSFQSQRRAMPKNFQTTAQLSSLTASSFRIWDRSAGILSPPLALFIVMLPKAQLSSHSRASSFRWVTTASWFSRSLSPFLYSSCVVLSCLLDLFCFC